MTATTSTPTRHWKRVGVQRHRTQWLVLAAILAPALAWLLWPVWGSSSSPNVEQAEAEAPWVLGALICGLTLLGVAIWHDAGRRTAPLAVACGLVLVDCALRLVLSPGLGGFEFVFVIPFLAGVARGAPLGFLVGGWAALLSTLVAGMPGTPLPMQVLVWGLVGVVGGLLHALPVRVAWPVATGVALPLGVGVGLLLNLQGWSYGSGPTTEDFSPGLPPLEVLQRLWAYSWSTSFVLDLTRGVVTAAGVLCLGRPLLTALRDTPDTWRVTTIRATDRVNPAALARRERRAGTDRIWN